jgi:hypothetical protein
MKLEYTSYSPNLMGRLCIMVENKEMSKSIKMFPAKQFLEEKVKSIKTFRIKQIPKLLG